MNKELLSYIQDGLAKGLSRAEITAALRQQAWDENAIQEAFLLLKIKPRKVSEDELKDDDWEKDKTKQNLFLVFLKFFLLVLLLSVFLVSVYYFFLSDILNDNLSEYIKTIMN